MVKKAVKILKKVLQGTIVFICLTGFLLQTYEFMVLYWTYPTVVDIQVSYPSEIDLPAVTFCNTNGIDPSVVCSLGDFCFSEAKIGSFDVCNEFSLPCKEGETFPPGYKKVMYQKFVAFENFNFSTLKRLRTPWEDYFRCKIISGKKERECHSGNLIMGSYYSDSDIINFCFTMNSLWSQPQSKIQKIKNSERIEMEFFMANYVPKVPTMPNYSYPIGFGIQLSLHSPYAEANPFIFGENFIGGKHYQIKLEQQEKHLLPPPYQTNCTDYLASWYERGGIGPLNQRMVNEECKFNRSLEVMGCVPISVDYPHNQTICKYSKEYPGFNKIIEECLEYQQRYSQPCFEKDYDAKGEEKYINIRSVVISEVLGGKQVTVHRIKGYNCSFERVWRKECQTVAVEIVFDGYQITNISYNAKYESMELFSIIGGNMGMYLGVSILAVYDFAQMIFTAFHTCIINRRAVRKEIFKKKKKKLTNKKTGLRCN